MFFDPMYFLFILPGLGLSLWESARVKRAFNGYSNVRSGVGNWLPGLTLHTEHS